MKINAVILTGSFYNLSNAKTAHGLVRFSNRFNIIGVIDSKSAGVDAGLLLEGKHRNIPIFSSIEEYKLNAKEFATFAIIGIAVPGGHMPECLMADIKDSIKAGLSVISGLHEFITEIPELSELSRKNKVELIDIRKPRSKDELKFWSGRIYDVKAPVIAVLGTDCNIGKRTTTTLLISHMQKKGVNAQMIFTGQTGWLQGNPYGFILDSTYNDFISGELENAVFQCFTETNPDIILIEGQSSLCNPSGPCGSEYILSANAKGVILQHSPARTYFEAQENLGTKVSIEKDIELIKLYGAQVLAITLNTKGLDSAQKKELKSIYSQKYKIPVILPLEDDLDQLADIIEKYIKGFSRS